MKLEELKLLERGDVVAFYSRGRDAGQTEHESFGLVVCSRITGVEILWEDGVRCGLYYTDDDADKLVLVSKIDKFFWMKHSPELQKMCAERKAKQEKESSP